MRSTRPAWHVARALHFSSCDSEGTRHEAFDAQCGCHLQHLHQLLLDHYDQLLLDHYDHLLELFVQSDYLLLLFELLHDDLFVDASANVSGTNTESYLLGEWVDT
jgi:hypothetical protein